MVLRGLKTVINVIKGLFMTLFFFFSRFSSMTILVDVGATKEDTGVLAVREALFSLKELWI